MNAKHTEMSIKISEESYTGIKLFIPYCDTQGCEWIGNMHTDKLSAREEGQGHLDKVKPHQSGCRARQAGDRPSLPGTQLQTSSASKATLSPGS